MTGETLRRLERVAELGIGLAPLPAITSHFVFERGGYVVLVERRGEGFGRVGAPGKLVEGHGYMALVRRDGADWWVARGAEWEAPAEEAAAARRLFTDLKAVLESEAGAGTS